MKPDKVFFCLLLFSFFVLTVHKTIHVYYWLRHYSMETSVGYVIYIKDMSEKHKN